MGFFHSYCTFIQLFGVFHCNYTILQQHFCSFHKFYTKIKHSAVNRNGFSHCKVSSWLTAECIPQSTIVMVYLYYYYYYIFFPIFKRFHSFHRFTNFHNLYLKTFTTFERIVLLLLGILPLPVFPQSAKFRPIFRIDL